jgi:hypothetical protein
MQVSGQLQPPAPFISVERWHGWNPLNKRLSGSSNLSGRGGELDVPFLLLKQTICDIFGREHKVRIILWKQMVKIITQLCDSGMLLAILPAL